MLDNGLIFGEAQAVTATTVAASSIPLSVARNIFQGEPLAVVVLITVAADHTTGDETYQWDVLSDDNAAMSSPTVEISRAIAATSLTAKSQWTIPVPIEAVQETFLGLRATLGGTTPSVTYSAWLAPQKDVQAWAPVKDALTIS